MDDLLQFENLPSILIILLGLGLVFGVPMFIHRKASTQITTERKMAIHLGAELIAIIGLLLLLWGIMNHFAFTPEWFSDAEYEALP